MREQGKWHEWFGPLDEKTARHLVLVSWVDPLVLGRLVTAHGSLVPLMDGDDWLPEGMTPDDVARRYEGELKALGRTGVTLLAPGEAGWPVRLARAYQPPHLLYIRGQVEPVSTSVGLGIVGSRYGAGYGERMAERFGRAWARLGGTIVSGGALGVDTAAHGVALQEGAPTIAVLATGVDRPHPRSNGRLFGQVLERGALVSELPLGAPPLPRNFPWRNRLIAGLSCAVVVTQAAAKSGALHTASFALKCGTKLFTVPSSLDDEASRGSLELLVKGVPALVQMDQLVALYAGACGTVPTGGTECLESPRVVVALGSLDGATRRVLEALKKGAQHIDDLGATTNMSQAALSLALLELELKDWVVKEAGNRYSCNVRLER